MSDLERDIKRLILQYAPEGSEQELGAIMQAMATTLKREFGMLYAKVQGAIVQDDNQTVTNMIGVSSLRSVCKHAMYAMGKADEEAMATLMKHRKADERMGEEALKVLEEMLEKLMNHAKR